MALRIPNGDNRRQFLATASTWFALAALVGLSLGVPVYQQAAVRAKESILEHNLLLLHRASIDYEKKVGKGPAAVADLVVSGILREVPIDPMTGRMDTWRITGRSDIRSGADQLGLNGKPYSRW